MQVLFSPHKLSLLNKIKLTKPFSTFYTCFPFGGNCHTFSMSFLKSCVCPLFQNVTFGTVLRQLAQGHKLHVLPFLLLAKYFQHLLYTFKSCLWSLLLFLCFVLAQVEIFIFCLIGGFNLIQPLLQITSFSPSASIQHVYYYWTYQFQLLSTAHSANWLLQIWTKNAYKQANLLNQTRLDYSHRL